MFFGGWLIGGSQTSGSGTMGADASARTSSADTGRSMTSMPSIVDDRPGSPVRSRNPSSSETRIRGEPPMAARPNLTAEAYRLSLRDGQGLQYARLLIAGSAAGWHHCAHAGGAMAEVVTPV